MEGDADVVNQTDIDGMTPLLPAALNDNEAVIKSLIHRGADVRATSTKGTATDYWREAGASIEQIAYLEVRAHCGNPACDEPGQKRCARCKQARYCSEACIRAQWPVHKLDCVKWYLSDEHDNLMDSDPIEA
jgi:hypothetical protein